MKKENKNKITSLALLGLCQALVMQPNIDAGEDKFNFEGKPNTTLLARGGCGGKGGCSGIVADNESAPINRNNKQQPQNSQSSNAHGSCGGKNGCSGIEADNKSAPTNKNHKQQPQNGQSNYARGGCGGKSGCSGIVADNESAPANRNNKQQPQNGPSSNASGSCGGKSGCSGIGADNTSTPTNKNHKQQPQNGQSPYARGGCGGKSGCSGIVADNDQPIKQTVKTDSQANGKKKFEYDPNSENLGYHLMSEEELKLELNDKGFAEYKSLSPEGQKLAREVASQRCARTNSCKGLNACATDKNQCAGKGGCKGQTKCGFSDKNLAVKVAAEKMKAKREGALK